MKNTIDYVNAVMNRHEIISHELGYKTINKHYYYLGKIENGVYFRMIEVLKNNMHYAIYCNVSTNGATIYKKNLNLDTEFELLKIDSKEIY